ncbi:MAG: cell division protein FtsW [Spirochaetes bacterium GWF1_31_7]|nr:MAG: cell division protein FtsW [Spirochaetes bacterium GWE1_32_154]OHD47607.1 MAG: cell division protein FtsW [Spirochaetes bacterium GWE2_31_10]OHD51268.1 MAG: cell division protein FtsW [Spirochaetes bacterium GWF1_31_7]OHD80432.1 MAG: cell division protein FtsW [Spirochaetes bacterium RIFOXYB1_FULL_32_8]HBD96165.1 putative lipid II flippase FtsW [Spirochaetia bacterium]
MKNIKDNSLDVLLIGFITILLGIGLGFLYTASQPVSDRFYGVPYHIVLKQAIHMGVGLVFFIFAIFIDHTIYKKYIKLLVFITLILLVITLIPGISKEIMGARRWLTVFGLSFQPSELAKLVVIIYLSSVLSNKEEYILDFYKGVFPPLCVLGVFLVFIFAGNDFSTTFLIIMCSFIIFYLAGVNIFTLGMMSLIGLLSSAIMIMLAPYRMKRLFAFINPWNDPLGSGWQTIQAMKCFALGKFFGVGLGESTQKNMALPEAHNDYIFAIIAEEGGAVAAVFIVILFFGLALIGLNISKRVENKYSYLLASGIIVMIFIQGIMNIGVVLGLLPATGITLPFISSGGTSLIVYMFMIGVLLNISLVNKKGLVNENR